MVANPESLHIQPYRVSQVGFDSCSTDGGEAVLSAPTNAPFVVEDKYLRPGSNFFIGKPLYKTSFNWPQCIIPLPHPPLGYGRLFLFSRVNFFLLLSLATQFAMRNYSLFPLSPLPPSLEFSVSTLKEISRIPGNPDRFRVIFGK